MGWCSRGGRTAALLVALVTLASGPPASEAVHEVLPPVLYWYEFTFDCFLYVKAITPASCTAALGDASDGPDIYVPRAIRDGIVDASSNDPISITTADPVLASSEQDVDRNWAACTVYGKPGYLPVYVMVQIADLLAQNGTQVVGLSGKAPSSWCS